MIPFIKEKLLENWILKLMAILLAWILWLFIQGESGTVTMVIAPVKVLVPPNMEITSELPPTVQVTIRGKSQPLDCIIDLQKAEEGENKIVLTDEQIKSPNGLGFQVSQVNPSYVTLALEEKISKRVPIAVRVQGDPVEGFEVYDRFPNPDKVEITGPRSHVTPVKEVHTEIIDLTGQNRTANFRVKLDFEDGKIQSSLSDPIWVEIRIGPDRKDYFIKNVPLILDNESYASSPKQIDIRVMAPESLKRDLVPDNFSATIVTKNLEGAASTR